MSRLPKITIRAQEVWPAFRGRAAEAPYSRGLRGLRGVSPATLLHLPPPRPQPRRRLLRVRFGPRGAPAGAGHSPSVRSGAGPGGARSGSARVLETALRRYIAPRLAALQPLQPRALRGAWSPGEPRPEEGRRPLPSPASAAVGIGRGG